MTNRLKSFRVGAVGIAASVLAGAGLVMSALPVPAFAGQSSPTDVAKSAPLNPQATLRLARAFRTAGDLKSAIYLYRSLAEQKGADPATRVALGDVLVEAGLVDDAMSVYGEVDPKSPDAPEALLGMASAELRLDDPAKALDYAERSLAAAPGEERALVARGVALDSLGRHVEAQASYRTALAQAPHSVAARTDLALSLAISGQYQAAIDLLGPIARSANSTPRLRQDLALVYGLKGDRATAVALGRVDLDADVAEANAHFFEMARQAPQ